MIWILITAILTSSLSFWMGFRRLLFLYEITLRRFLIFSVISLLIYSFLLFLFKIEILSEAIGGAIITNVYASIFGFFTGSSINQYNTRVNSGKVLYCHRSFISEFLPVIVALGIILFGIYRSALFSELPATPIRISTGLSLIGIGLWGITLRPVPEFRIKGIVLLDSVVDWQNMLSYEWFTEEILEIDYTQDDSIRSFKTLIPPENQLKVERLLSKKMKEKLEEEN